MVRVRRRVSVAPSTVSRSTPNTCTMPVGGKSSGGIKEVSRRRVGEVEAGARGSLNSALLNSRFKEET